MVILLFHIFRYSRSLFYQPSFHDPDFVCSLPQDRGTSKCSDIYSYYLGNNECQGSFENNSVVNDSVCVNWNKYYISCRPDGQNPFYDTTSFDNIGIAWIAIFQVNAFFLLDENQQTFVILLNVIRISVLQSYSFYEFIFVEEYQRDGDLGSV